MQDYLGYSRHLTPGIPDFACDPRVLVHVHAYTYEIIAASHMFYHARHRVAVTPK